MTDSSEPGHGRRAGAAAPRGGIPAALRIAAIVGGLALGPPAGAATFPKCADLFVADAADVSGGPTGSVLAVDSSLPPDGNALALAGFPGAALLSHVAATPGRIAILTDMDADPAGLGADPNGNPGRGALFRYDGATGVPSLFSDGTVCEPSIAFCTPGVFVDPISVAYPIYLGDVVVADVDADPSGFGPDTLGFAGHGAVFRVDRVDGRVDLLSDGSNYPAGIPNGAPSIFEDPIAVALAPDATLYVLDQLADPLAAGRPGALFRVIPVSGEVSLVSASPRFVGVRDAAVEPGETILVLDRLARGSGALFRIDPALPPADNVIAEFTAPDFVEPSGVAVAGNGTIYVVDAAADPLSTGASGAVFQIDPALTAATPVSSPAGFVLPWSVDVADPLSLDDIDPPSAQAVGQMTITVTGGPFRAPLQADFGPDIFVGGIQVLDPRTVEIDILLDGAQPGPHDVYVGAPIRGGGFRCAFFEVTPPPQCPVLLPIGPTLRVTRPDPGPLPRQVRLDWVSSGDGCTAGTTVHRALTARPATPPGQWPLDPPFADITAQDLDGDTSNTIFRYDSLAGSTEYYLLVEFGPEGQPGPVCHYEFPVPPGCPP